MKGEAFGMTTVKPTFRVMRNGYDRFAVDDAVERYTEEIRNLEKQLEVYSKQLEETSDQLELLQQRYTQLEKSMDAEKEAAESIARLSLREANEIIATAQKNADAIVRQALVTARLILTDLSKLYGDADVVKGTTKAQLENLIKELDEFKLPKMPDLKWLEEAEKKMR